MKILVVCQYYYPENFSITSLCEEWVKLGHEVFVVTGKPNYGYGRILEGYENVVDEVIHGVRVHRVPLRPRKESKWSIIRNYLSFWFHSKRYLSRLKENFDVVYSMSLSPVISIAGANRYAKKHHVKHILHCLDLWPESVSVTGAVSKKNPMFGILYLWSKMLYSKTDKILVSSPSFEEYFRKVLKLKNHPIEYLPQPPFLAELQGEPVVFSHRYNVVYAGNLGTLQLVENLAKATLIAAKSEDVVLHIMGMGTRAKALESFVEEQHASEHIALYGTRPRGVAATFYPNSTAIVVTLKQDGVVGKTIPSKLVSSLSYGRPILASIGGDGKKVLEEAGGTVFSNGETPDELAEAILKLCRMSEGEREEAGRKNAAYFSEHFSLPTIAVSILDELQ